MSVGLQTSSFVVLWTGHRVRAARSSGWRGNSLPYLFGGPHSSHPSPSKAGVAPGDRVFPIAFQAGRLMVLCECVVEEIVSIDVFCQRFDVRRFESTQSEFLRAWLSRRSCAWLAPTCTDDAILLRSSTPLEFDRLIPLDQAPHMRMANRRGERRLRNVLPDGRLKNALTLHGRYYKASPATAELLSVVARTPPEEKSEPGLLWPTANVTQPLGCSGPSRLVHSHSKVGRVADH
jgi:hypothetical protein